MEKKIENILSGHLLSEMETLEIHGGLGLGPDNPNAINVFCGETKCLQCDDKELPNFQQKCGDINIYC